MGRIPTPLRGRFRRAHSPGPGGVGCPAGRWGVRPIAPLPPRGYTATIVSRGAGGLALSARKEGEKHGKRDALSAADDRGRGVGGMSAVALLVAVSEKKAQWV
jgi:hypothetical protein